MVGGWPAGGHGFAPHVADASGPLGDMVPAESIAAIAGFDLTVEAVIRDGDKTSPLSTLDIK